MKLNSDYISWFNRQGSDAGSYTDTMRSRISQRAMSIDNISFLTSPSSQIEYVDDDNANSETSSNESPGGGQTMMEPPPAPHQTMMKPTEEKEDENIIPWKKLLRKTNSRLNLIS